MSDLTRLLRSIECLFCRKAFAPRDTPPEHVIPQSFYGTFTTYYVCRRCNEYFARKLETSLQEYPEVRTARSRIGGGQGRRNPPLQVTDTRRFKRFMGKVALEFLGETNHSVATNSVFDRWRGFVRRDIGGVDLLNRVSYRDIYQEMPGWKPNAGRSWHGISLLETNEEVLCSISFYSQIVATVLLGPLPKGQVIRWYGLVQKMVRRRSKYAPNHMLHQFRRPHARI